jgi:anti-sigma factor RsiW
MTHLSDEFLLAYLDGQLEKSQAAGLSQLAGDNPEVSRRLTRLKRTQAQLLDTFGAFAREEAAVPASVFDEEEGKEASKAKPELRPGPPMVERGAPKAPRQMFFVAAVFAGGVLGGYGATLLTGQRPAILPPKSTDRPPAAMTIPTSWTNDIARFHTFFPRETLTPHPDAISNIELIRFQLAKVAAKALTLPDFSHQGYTLFRGQVFNYHQDRMMQLTYSSKTEPPLTLYVLPAPELRDAPITTQTLGSNKAASWVSDRVRFFLTGDKNEEDLKVLAVLAQSQMPRKG